MVSHHLFSGRWGQILTTTPADQHPEIHIENSRRHRDRFTQSSLVIMHIFKCKSAVNSEQETRLHPAGAHRPDCSFLRSSGLQVVVVEIPESRVLLELSLKQTNVRLSMSRPTFWRFGMEVFLLPFRCVNRIIFVWIVFSTQ